MANIRRLPWNRKAAQARMLDAAHATHLEVVRTMPVHGRAEDDLFTTGMLHAARQSVQDSAVLHTSLIELCDLDPAKALRETVREASEAVARLYRLRESWMRHRPPVEEMYGLPGARLLHRVDRGDLAGVAKPGPWADDDAAQAAMQLALPPLEQLETELARFTGTPLTAIPPVGL